MFTYSIHRENKTYLLSILKENRIFILFSFLSCLMPITFCLLASLVKPDGSQVVMALGHVMPFLLAFMQISFTISMIIFAKLRDLKNLRQEDERYVLISSTIWMSLFIGFIMTIFYVVSTFCYMYFSNNRPNTQGMLWYGLDFTWVTIPFVFLFPLYICSIFYIRKNETKSSLLLLFVFFVISTLLSFLFGNVLGLKSYGFGIGLTVGLIVSFIINCAYIHAFNPITIYSPFSVSEFNIAISRIILKESMTSISMSLFKGIAIICLSFTIPNTISGFVPLSYQMSRVIWFNMMYFIPFLGIGIGEGIRYHYLSKHSPHNNHNCYLNHRWRNDLKIIFAAAIITLLISTGCIFMVKPLNYLYTQNDYNTFKNGSMPMIEGWGVPTLPPTEFIDFQHLKELEFTPLPEFKPTNTGNKLQDALNKVHNLSAFRNWVDLQIQNNKEALNQIGTDLNSLNKWYEWLNQENNGVILLDFIQEKHGINFKDEINSIIAGNQISEGMIGAVKGCLSYFVYLWLYSSTNSIVTDSFLLLRPIIDYNNVITSSPNILIALVNNPFSDILTSLFLTINTFEAKAMIYVAIWGFFNSIWAILIQVNQRNLKEGMPYWLLTVIYAVCIGGLVTFGTLFAVTFKDVLGTNNPFNYLDAWTFPLVIISFAVITVLSIKCFVSYKKLKNENEKFKSGAN